MKTNHALVVLVGATLILQIILFYRESRDRSALQRPVVQDAPKGISIDLEGVPMKGSKEASVMLVEFSDYECPFCERHATTVGVDLDREFVRVGKIQYAFVNNPLPVHPNAKLLATAAICAGEYDQYWPMHDRLFTAKPQTKSEILSLANSIGLDPAEFTRCINTDPAPSKQIEADMKKAGELHFTGTPAFAVGHLEIHNRVIIRKFIFGAQPVNVFRKAINEVLSTVSSPS